MTRLSSTLFFILITYWNWHLEWKWHILLLEKQYTEKYPGVKSCVWYTVDVRWRELDLTFVWAQNWWVMWLVRRSRERVDHDGRPAGGGGLSGADGPPPPPRPGANHHRQTSDSRDRRSGKWHLWLRSSLSAVGSYFFLFPPLPNPERTTSATQRRSWF